MADNGKYILQTDRATIKFGGLTAVNELTMDVQAGVGREIEKLMSGKRCAPPKLEDGFADCDLAPTILRLR